MTTLLKTCIATAAVGLAGLAAMAILPRSAVADEAAAAKDANLPRMIEVGSTHCAACKKMAPIIDELKRELAGKLEVSFLDVGLKENLPAAKAMQIKAIPTQIFISADGKELWRHEGFIARNEILAKWKQFGHDFAGETTEKIERWEPAKKDERTPEQICYMSDRDIDPRTVVVAKTDKGQVRIRDLHHFFILMSCLTEDRKAFQEKVSVADYASGAMVPLADAIYLRGADETTGRPWIRAFASREAALAERKSSGGSIVSWNALEAGELAVRCGFCDRACYPQDSARVLIGGVHSHGCCAHCAMGIAARTGKDIEVHQPDALTGEAIVIKTLNGSVASIEPKTAVAWFGKKKNADGKWVSAGCFHQGFFTSPQTLRKWLEQNPLETGEMITIHQSLADKMKLTPQQIAGACKIGQCAPK